MRLFAISDLHIDFQANRNWLFALSQTAYKHDALILAGDLTDIEDEFRKALEHLKSCFKEVFFVPGNHDLWVWRDPAGNSLDKFLRLNNIARELGIHTGPAKLGSLLVVPFFAWYDYSFGAPSEKLMGAWTDFKACAWPDGYSEKEITNYFLALNELTSGQEHEYVISYSHFLPRIDLMPSFIPQSKRMVFPVLGTSALDRQIREVGSDMHIYGHSHVNRQAVIEDVVYINNAFGYPHEAMITSKKLLCVYDCDKMEALPVSGSIGNRVF